MGKLINKQDTIDKIKKETLINYSVAVMAEVAERAKQEDAPIYEEDVIYTICQSEEYQESMIFKM